MVDFVEICNVCARKAIIVAAKRIIYSDKVCRSYSDLNFGVLFLEHSVLSIFKLMNSLLCIKQMHQEHRTVRCGRSPKKLACESRMS